MKKLSLTGTLAAMLLAAACQSASEHAAEVQRAGAADRNLTVGTVQREIRAGMSGADVAAVLGSPNVVTSDEQRREVWIYDRISTSRVFSTSSGGINTLILGGAASGGALGGAGAGVGYGSSAGASATTQRTLTVIVKFDENARVRDFAYHSSRF